MYAVIRAGGKQYRVAPGDVIRLENQGDGTDGKIEFNDVLAFSGDAGQIGVPKSPALVTGEVVEQGRGAKILVFHYKRKKQYKKLRGHRQGYTAVRITEIAVDGQKFSAPELLKKEPKPKRQSRPTRRKLPRSRPRQLSPQERRQQPKKRRQRRRLQKRKSSVGRSPAVRRKFSRRDGPAKSETRNWKPDLRYGT